MSGACHGHAWEKVGGRPPSSSRSSEFGKRRVTRPTSALAAPRMPGGEGSVMAGSGMRALPRWRCGGGGEGGMRRTRVRPEVGLELGQLRPAAEEELDVGEAEADAARDGLRRVAADEEAVLVGGRVVQQRQLRHGQVLHLVDDDLVQRRVAPRLRLEVEDLSRRKRLVDGEPVRTAATVAELGGAPGRTRRTGHSSSSS